LTWSLKTAMLVCCKKRNPEPPLDVWAELLDGTLTPHSAAVAVERVARIATRLRTRVWRLGWYYRCLKTFVSLGALLVPSLTGLDGDRVQSRMLFWLIWAVSLATSVSNAFISLFGIDRCYFACKDQLAVLEAEAWSFVALSGRYKNASHQEQFTSFMERCEGILDKALRRGPGDGSNPKGGGISPMDDGRSDTTPQDVAEKGPPATPRPLTLASRSV